MREQKCAICGKPFEAHRDKKYCSEECALRALEEAVRAAKKENLSYLDFILSPRMKRYRV